MPQMAPLNWLTLFFLFIIIFILFNITNFFFLNYKYKKLVSKKKSTKFNWSW
uniref:ATP synthase complex subunit 8 n=1 Tax=Cerambycidae sp. 6 KM-2017 TaxID=2219291 RepID=A0A346RGS5_9CUCU|nr:ATP synthase F0 subunit 8 [Cerambycidae sp. 6 KM-2017]